MLHIDAEVEKRGQRFAEISGKFPKVASIIRARTELAADHYLQWQQLTNQELQTLELYFTKMPFAQDYFAKRRLHPTYQELLIILENKLSFRIFELVHLTTLFDALAAESDVFLRFVVLAEEAELLNQILAYASVKQLIKPDTIQRLLSLTKDHLSDLLNQVQRNDACANVTNWLNLFSDFCSANHLAAHPVIPERIKVNKATVTVVQPVALPTPAATPTVYTDIYQKTIERLEAYTERVKKNGFSHGFCYFVDWQTQGRIANYNQAMKWLTELKRLAETDREGSLAMVFDPASKRDRSPKRWHDFFTGITSKELAAIEKDVMQHIKITAPLTRVNI